MIFEQWVFGRTSGSKQHAVKRSGLSEHPITGESNSAYTIHALCGARDAQGMLNASNDLFDPSARDNVCDTCVRRWTARYAPQMPGWTKECKACGTDKPINQFHVDKRTRDQLSTRCLECEEGAKRAVKQAEQLLERAAFRQRLLAEEHQRHTRRLAALVRWQNESTLPTFACSEGHPLNPVTGARRSDDDLLWPIEQWECACDLVEVTPEQRDAAIKAALALDSLDSLRDLMKAV
jgi:predicted nucleic acid-binding Zn ribbon protein